MRPAGQAGTAVRAAILALTSVLCVVIAGPHALGYEFKRVLRRGSHGRDVRALEVRVVGWFPSHHQHRLIVDKSFGHRTVRAVKAFQRHYGLTVDGIAGPQTFKKISTLQNGDGSTAHFDWSEFVQKSNDQCAQRADSFAGSFRGGRVGKRRVKHNLGRWMWRLEAIRAKSGDRRITITSGFRSIPYNRCIGGARLSQHLYGMAVDINIAGLGAHRERTIARRSQVHGIACYSTEHHNHLDLRIENARLPAYRQWWWPERDHQGRDLTDDGRPCRGEHPR